jgi:hypothetical protein
MRQSRHPIAGRSLRAILAAAAATVALGTATARATPAPTPGLQCDDAIRTSARLNGTPLALMAAIGVVESGRPEPSGAVRSWPWTINAEGRGMFFDNKAAAVAAVRALQAGGMRSIDVGCMQVNLMHHPDAFASLDEAFDPRRNALYAGRFLNQLFRQSQDWLVAAGQYHSSTPGLAGPYVRQVAAALHGGSGRRGWGRATDAEWTTQPAAPVIGRDGTILPSIRLTSAGLLRERTVETPARRKLRLSAWNTPAARPRLHGS